MDIRGNLEFGGPEDIPEADTLSGPARAKYGDNEVPGSTSGVQETEGDYGRDGG